MIIPSLLQKVSKPDFEDYERCLEDKEIPVTLRKQIINSYRRCFRERFPPQVNIVYKPKLRRRWKYCAKPRPRNSSANNFFNTTIPKIIVRLTSGGRRRPSRKVKYQFKSVSRTVHLKGTIGTWSLQ